MPGPAPRTSVGCIGPQLPLDSRHIANEPLSVRSRRPFWIYRFIKAHKCQPEALAVSERTLIDPRGIGPTPQTHLPRGQLTKSVTRVAVNTESDRLTNVSRSWTMLSARELFVDAFSE
ncbi:hypothetical protein KM043_015015 [Ampulex compressa]|nr:hypothetical protein KM043_015015 [Ampulex compressa]